METNVIAWSKIHGRGRRTRANRYLIDLSGCPFRFCLRVNRVNESLTRYRQKAIMIRRHAAFDTMSIRASAVRDSDN